MCRTAREALISLGVECPSPSIAVLQGHRDNRGYPYNKDLWRLDVARKTSLLKLCELLDPHLKHAKRRRDMEAVRLNIVERGRRLAASRLPITEEELRHLYEEQGLTQPQIAAYYSCTPSTISWKMREFGIPRRPRRLDIEEADLRRWYGEEGLTLEEIAARVGCSLATVHRRVTEYGVRKGGGK